MNKKIFSLFMLIMALGFVTSGFVIAVQGASDWTVKIDGAVSNSTTLTINDLVAMPRSTVYGEIYCYGRFVTGGNWTGVSLRFLLESVAFDQNAGSVAFYAGDGYTIDISIQEAMRPDVIIAYELDGQPLSETLRLVLPGQNGNRWIAQINQITVSMAAASSQPSAASAELAPVGQQSPTPQPTPTPTPQANPSPSPTPSSSPTPSVSPPTAKPEPEPFPIALTVIAIATVTVGGIGLTVYFKKRNH